jgi:hypothetical protein
MFATARDIVISILTCGTALLLLWGAGMKARAGDREDAAWIVLAAAALVGVYLWFALRK